jgi:hypothetical protein
MKNYIKRFSALTIFFTSLMLLSPASIAGLIEYDSSSDEWSVTGWSEQSLSGIGAFAPSSFTGYTSTNGVAMLRNDYATGWWIGDVQTSTYSSHYAGDELSIFVIGATWGGYS